MADRLQLAKQFVRQEEIAALCDQERQRQSVAVGEGLSVLKQPTDECQSRFRAERRVGPVVVGLTLSSHDLLNYLSSSHQTVRQVHRIF